MRQVLLSRLRNWRSWAPHVPVALWLTMGLATAIVAWVQPHRLNMKVYRVAVESWWAGADLYSEGIHGFLYLPPSVTLFMPFVWLGPGWDDQAWRWLQFLLYTSAAWRLARLLAPGRPYGLAAFAAILILPAAGSDMVRGNASIAMMALLIHAAVDMARGRWTVSAAAAALAFALKPLAIAWLLVAGVLYRPLRWRLPLLVALLFVLPFLTAPADYVLAQYLAAGQKLLVAGQPDSGRWNDIAALLGAAGFDWSSTTVLALRAAAALAVLGLAWTVRDDTPERRAALQLMLCVTYILVFNPRTEQGGYMTLALFAGLLAGWAWGSGQRLVAGALVVFALALGTQAYGAWIYRPTDRWLKPALGLTFLALLAGTALWRRYQLTRQRRVADESPQSADIPPRMTGEPATLVGSPQNNRGFTITS